MSEVDHLNFLNCSARHTVLLVLYNNAPQVVSPMQFVVGVAYLHKCHDRFGKERLLHFKSANYNDFDTVLVKQIENHLAPLFFLLFFSGLAELMIWWNNLSGCNSFIQLIEGQ